MVNNDVIDDFYNIFVEKDFITIIKQYSSFRKEAIEDRNYFIEWIKRVYKVDNYEKDNTYKQCFVETARSIHNCLYYDCTLVIYRQNLIDCIGERVGEYFKLLYGNDEYGDDVCRFAILHLMIDMFFSYSNTANKIRWSAMLYNLLSDWNKQNNNEFNQFYGKDAEEDIVEYTLQSIKILSKNASDWLEQTEILNLTHKKNIADFRDKLLKKEKMESSIDKSSGRVDAISNSKHSNRSNIESGNNHKNNYTRSILNKELFLIGVILSLMVGFVIGSTVNSSSAKLRSLEKELSEKTEIITHYEHEIADKNESYAELKNYIDELKKQSEESQDTIDSSKSTEETHTEQDLSSSNSGVSIITSNEDIIQESNPNLETYSFDEGRRIRASKDTDPENIIGYIEPGQVVEVVEPIDSDNWIGIQFGDAIGYVKVK